MNRKQKKALWRILLSALLFALGLVLTNILSPSFGWRIAIMLPAYLLIGYDVLWKAAGGIGRGQVFDENFLMGIASLGAFAVGQASEGVAVMLFYQVGELFQNIAVGKSRKSIADLLDILPESTTVLKDGEEVTLCPEDVQVGDILLIRPGEKIPLDGKIIEGKSSLDTASLTGESLPKDVEEGDAVYSGTVNLQGVLKIKCTKPYEQSTATKIMELVEESQMHKAKTEKFITRFAKFYTPIVVLLALGLAVIPPLFIGISDYGIWSHWIHTALVFLIVSCPCALVISVPMTFFGGIGGASRHGILIKGASHLENLSKVETVVFDKTGTLTKGHFSVSEIHAVNGSKEALLQLAATAEYHSHHPLALSIKEANTLPIDTESIKDYTEMAGAGIKVTVNGKCLLAGKAKLLLENGIDGTIKEDKIGTYIHLAEEKTYLGYILLDDTPKEDAQKAIQDLYQMGLNTVLLSGDRKETAMQVGKQLGIAKIHAELLPRDKVDLLNGVCEEASGNVAYVGDGINDAPVLARADIGIAMGALGSEAAIEASDIVIMDDKPSSVVKAISLSKKTMKIVRQNIVLALGVKIAIMLLDLAVAASLIAIPQIAMTWIAVFGDVGVAIIAILNSLRAIR